MRVLFGLRRIHLFKGEKGKSHLVDVQSYWGNLPNIVMLIRRGAFYKYNICVYIYIYVYIYVYVYIYICMYISYKEIGCVCHRCVWVCICT